MATVLTAEQLAEALQLNHQTVLRMTREGVLPHIKIRGATRYHLEDILASLRVSTHSEDHAVDQLAKAMHERLAEKRAEGRQGWEDCDTDVLWDKLIASAAQGDAVDAANYAAMIYAQEKAR